MTVYEAPAKLNLSLHVDAPGADGYHPLRSMVQTIEWCDLLEVVEGEGSDSLEINGIEVPIEGNLVLEALAAVRQNDRVPPLALALEKTIPAGAGLGGGSSDAAAAIVAAIQVSELEDTLAPDVAVAVGADVSLFLTGGTLMMSGVGGDIEPLRPLETLAFAVAVPQFGLSTAEVYRHWDEMEGPEGEPLPDHALPPGLRDGMPMRNDLTPAAVDLEPRLGDFIADLRSAWGTSVSLTGSGSACFGYFGSLDEAEDATRAVAAICSAARGVAPRRIGIGKVQSSSDRV